MSQSLEYDYFLQIEQALASNNILEKIELTNNLYQMWCKSPFAINNHNNLVIKKFIIPGRPSLPQLVSPKMLVKRKMTTISGRAALMHAIAHIEFNAINLALDAAYRFLSMPAQYYGDWLKIASEEAYHFNLINDYLKNLGYSYGDFVAHNGLWEMAVKTQHDVLIRMALVPRILEARGLDVTPQIQQKFVNIADFAAVKILEIIEQDEIHHVNCGSYWFKYLCTKRNLPPLDTFKDLILRYDSKPQLKLPFATKSRLNAGFSFSELEMLEQMIVK